MHHSLLVDLAVILGAAGLVSLIFKRIGQPIVLGYLVAGMLLSPHTPGEFIQDLANVKAWAELGVVFLMFSLGLEFTFHKLVRVGNTAFWTALVQVVCMVVIGAVTGRLFGLSPTDSLFLGGMISISSTTIIMKAFEALGLKTERFVEIVFGILIVEDLFAILILVLLPILAANAEWGMHLTYSGLQLIVVVGGWFLIGYFFIPSFFKITRRFVDDETLTILALGLCLFLGVLALRFDYSPALGAFIMGSILAETREAHRIEILTRPIKNVFASIFFVSVGMLMNPALLFHHIGLICLLSVLVIVGKATSVAVGASLTGQPLKRSILIGMSLGQIGEFSFIIAGLGSTLGVTSEVLYPVAVGVSIITTFTTPYLIKGSLRFAPALEKAIPKKLRETHVKYSSWVQRPRQEKGYLKRALRFLLNGIVVTGIFAAFVKFQWIPLGILSWTVAVLLSAPFVWGMFFAFRSETSVILFFFGQLLTVMWLGILSTAFFSSGYTFAITLFAAAITFMFFYRRLETSYRWFESRLIGNLKQNTRSSDETMSNLAPWDLSLVPVTVHPNSPVVGKSLLEARIRERLGCNIVVIQRGEDVIPSPRAVDRIYPMDSLLLLGTEDQVAKFRREVEFPAEKDIPITDLSRYSLKRFALAQGSEWIGKTLRASNIRAHLKGLVVGLERGDLRTINPDPEFVLRDDDVLWFVGEE